MNLYANAGANYNFYVLMSWGLLRQWRFVSITETTANIGALVWLRMQQHALSTCMLGQCLHAMAIQHELDCRMACTHYQKWNAWDLVSMPP